MGCIIDYLRLHARTPITRRGAAAHAVAPGKKRAHPQERPCEWRRKELADMKVLTLNPPFHHNYSRESRSPAVTKGGCVYWPMWLSYTTGALMQANFKTKLLDAAVKNRSMDDVLGLVKGFKPDLVVMDSSTPSVKNDVQVLERIKEENDCFGVLVGPHVTATPDETLALSPKLDAVARGEHDHIVRDLALELDKRSPDLSKVQGLSYRDRDKVKHNPGMPQIEDLDSLPFVSSVYREFLDEYDYFYPANLYPEVMIVTSRGCQYRHVLPWPQTMTGHVMRKRSIENVLAEFDFIAEKFPDVRDKGEIFLEDDTFTQDKERARAFSALKAERGNPMTWSGNARADVDLGNARP